MQYTNVDKYIDTLTPSETLQLAMHYGLIDRSDIAALSSLGDLEGLFKRLKKGLKRLARKVKKVVKKVAPIVAVGAAVYFGGPAAASALMNLAMKKRAAKAAEMNVPPESLPIQQFYDSAPQPGAPIVPQVTPIVSRQPAPAPVFMPMPVAAPESEPMALTQAAMPQWVIPTAIGAIGLVLALVMDRKR